jgi:hypothetical protein
MDKNKDIMRQIKIQDFMEKEFLKNNLDFFSYAWRENVLNFMEKESKFSYLIKWVNERLSLEFMLINTQNPADRDENYTIKNIKTYMDSCKNVGILLNLKFILMDDKSTTKMREDVEHTICKLYNLYYKDKEGYFIK